MFLNINFIGHILYYIEIRTIVVHVFAIYEGFRKLSPINFIGINIKTQY